MNASRRCSLAAVALAAIVSAGVIASPSAAAASAPTSLGCSGALIVDVSARIVNEADGGVAGNVWALLNIEERARIYQESERTFCVVETDKGWFRTFAGVSPGATGTVLQGRIGRTSGVQRFEVTGTFSPSAPITGSLGTFDFGCDQSGNCPGNVRFSQLYFTGISGVTGATFSERDTSRGHRHGSWTQTGTISTGDITG